MPEFPTMSSGYTNRLAEKTIYEGLPQDSVSDKCCSGSQHSGPTTFTQLPSLLLASRSCPPPTPASFALYPKVAVPCSVRTQALNTCTINAGPLASSQRFSKYQRFRQPVPCPPLPASARMAGISKPSTRACNL